jgi:hypothetical protein
MALTTISSTMTTMSISIIVFYSLFLQLLITIYGINSDGGVVVMVSALHLPQSNKYQQQRQRHSTTSSRRQWFQQSIAGISTLATFTSVTTTTNPSPAHAGGLLQFPVTTVPLKNKYHLIRAGTSELERDGIYSTNPLFLTNRENQMDPKEGIAELQKAVTVIQQQPPTVVYHSLAANGMDTGDYIARSLNLGRDRLLPEFTYLDQRGIGLWDSSDGFITRPAVWALDEGDAGPEGFGGRPPANEDGTPNETLHDQFIRLRQFLSLQESRTSGEIILIIFPDGTGPALLSCMIAGIPFSKCHVLEMSPGEVRLDITTQSIREMYEQRKDDPAYLETIEKGKQTLKELKEKQKDGTLQEWISLKDSKAQEEQLLIEKQYQEKKRLDEEKRILKEEKEKRSRLLQQETKKERQRQQKMTTTTTTTEVSPTMLGIGAVASLGVVGIGAAVFSGNGDDNKKTVASLKKNGDDTLIAIDNAISVTEPLLLPSTMDDDDDDETTNTDQQNSQKPVNDALRTLMDPPTQEAVPAVPSRVSSSSFTVNNDDTVNDVSDEEEFNVKMTTAERNLKNALKEAAVVKDQKRTMKLYGGGGGDDDTSTNMMNDNSPPLKTYDADSDGSDDWLRVLVEIRDDEEEFFEQRQEESIVAAVNGGDESMKNFKNDSGNSTTLSKDI